MEPGELFRQFALDLRHVKGRWAGQPFALEPWQLADMTELLRRDANGRRIYREGLLMMGRKNGKSALASALALYALVVEGALFDPGAEVYAAAASKEQAQIVFGEAKKMVEASPFLRDRLKIYRNTIVVPDTQAVFRVLASDAWNVHGLSPSVVIADEVHAWKDAELWHALSTAGMARQDPLMFGISHAGYTKDSLLGELYERGKSGQPGFFFKSYEVAEENRDKREHWKEANPASWITVEALEKEYKRHPPAIFYRFHLNAWVKAEELWLPPGAWDACRDDSLTIEPGDAVWVGVDLGLRHDSTALVEVCPKDGRYIVRARIFQTHQDPSKPMPKAHEVIEDDHIEIATIENALREIGARQEVRGVVYDPWRFQRSAELLSSQLIMIEHPMSNERMAPASQGLFDAITEGKIAHNGDPYLTAHIEAAVARDTERGWRLDKKKAKEKMDASIALAIALSTATFDSGFNIRFF